MTIECRYAHQAINGALFEHFVNCAQLQGVQISEDTASQTDILVTSWDLRDNNTRKLQKLRELIFRNAVENREDPDLMNILSDLEKVYSSEENNH